MRDRRSFLRQSSLASASIMIPDFLRVPFFSPQSSREGPILIMIQLSGGNDGLNTIIPYRNELYYKLRPEISIGAPSLIKLSDEIGLNPALGALQEIFDQGELCILNDVGYPNPDRSHFRSMDIWHTGSDADEHVHSGWLGRYLDSDCEDCNLPYHAIEIGDNVSLALHGKQRDALAMRGPEKLRRATSDPFLLALGKKYQTPNTGELSFLYKTMVEVQESAEYLTRKAKTHRSKFNYPNHAFGEGMCQIAELITADTNTKIYYISLPGFDTHVNQKARQHNLLSIYSQSVSTFIKDLRSNGLFEDIVIVTFSEFGRRVQENGSLGTDHGAANNLLVMGDKLKSPGFYNAAPTLNDLDDGDLPYKIDFRSVYADILANGLQTDPLTILGKTVPLEKSII